jgi:ribosome-associated protein
MTKRAPTAIAVPAEKPRPQRQSIEAARVFAVEAARTLSDDKCEDVVVLDVSGISPVSDFIVIGSGTSERQMRSVLSHVEDMGQETGFPPFRVSDDERATWLLADFVDVVVHVFEPNTRAHYDLEMLWGDSTRVVWERPAGHRAGARA